MDHGYHCHVLDPCAVMARRVTLKLVLRLQVSSSVRPISVAKGDGQISVQILLLEGCCFHKPCPVEPLVLIQTTLCYVAIHDS